MCIEVGRVRVDEARDRLQTKTKHSLYSMAVLVERAKLYRRAVRQARAEKSRGDWGSIFLAASPLSSAPDKTAMLDRLNKRLQLDF